jgi:hypothetical protein
MKKLLIILCLVCCIPYGAMAQNNAPSFDILTRNFVELKLEPFLDVPITKAKTIWGKYGSRSVYQMSKYYIPSFSRKLPANYFQAFFVNDLGHIKRDSVPVLDTNSTRAHCIGKFKLDNPANIVTLLMGLEVKQDNYYGRQYYALVHYTPQGKAIDYQIIGRKKWLVHTSPRLSVHNGRLLVEQIGWAQKQGKRQPFAERYWLSFGKGGEMIKQATDFSMLTAGTPQTQEGIEYWNYCHAKLPYCVQLPAKVLRLTRKNWSKTMGETFSATDGKASLSINQGGWTSKGKSLQETIDKYLAFYLKSGLTKGIQTHRKVKDGFVLKGKDEDGDLFFKKMLLVPVGKEGYTIIRANLVYPVEQATLYNKIIKQLEKSFRRKPKK